MRPVHAGLPLVACLLCLCSSFALAWTNEDHEIFDLVSDLQAAEGPKVDFYSYLNVSSKATTTEIAKMYRKRSLEVHPDRGGNQEAFARMGTIANILRDAEKRKRYQYFYENGVPRWRGTGYYYSRYRPGLGTVLIFLTFFSCIIQYMVQYLTRYSEVQRIKRFQDRAKEAAWGPTLQPPPGSSGVKKRVRVQLGANENPANAVPMMVEADGRVSLIDSDGSTHPLDASAARQPSLSSTWLPTLLHSLYLKIASKPASISSLPASTEMGDIDAINTPTEGLSENDASRPGTPVDGGNRRSRRAEVKGKKKRA